MTPKEKYQDIDLSKLPEKAVEQLEKVKPFLFEAKYESEENKEVKAKGEQALEKLYTLISEKYPESIKSKQAKAPEPKTPQAIAKKVAKDSVKQPAKGKSTASAKPTKRGEISRLAKEIRKDGERFQDAMKRAGEMIQAEKKKAVTNANKQYKKLAAFLKKNPTISQAMVSRGKKPNITKYPLDVNRDAPRKALPAGRRVSKDGNIYYEYRQNRTDKHRKRYPYLALGGKLHGAGMFEGGGKYAKGGEMGNFNWENLSFKQKLDLVRESGLTDSVATKSVGMITPAEMSKLKNSVRLNRELNTGKYAKGGVLKKKMTALWNEYQENQDENYHGENVVLLAKHFGTKEDLKEAKRILAEHEKQGYLTDKLRKERDELHHKLYPKFVKALKEEGVIMAKGGKINNFTDYYLVVNLDERGDYSADVRNPLDETVYSIDTAEQMNELIEDGFLRYKADEDLDRLTKYLMSLNIIPNGSQIYSEEEFDEDIRPQYEDEEGHYAKGGELNNLMPHSKTHRTHEK